MSPIWSPIVTALGGLLAGLALAAGPLWRLQRALTRARYAAEHDDTTGLPNRRALLAALTRALRQGAPVGVVLLDLDKFKTINDTFSHQVGNDLLTEVGRRLTALEPPVLFAARLSGDEFALLVTGGSEQVAGAARAAWRAVSRRPVTLGARQVSIQASVGHVTAGPGATPGMLLHHADQAMYQAKQAGSGVHAALPSTANPILPPGTRCRDLRHD